MHAISYNQAGTTEVLTYTNWPTPSECGDEQVIVQLKAAGINPIDIKIRTTPERFPVSLPTIPGCDGAGIICALGSKVKNFHLGDEVYFSQPGFNGRQGTYAEYVVVEASLLALKPRSLSFMDAAAAPLVFITAWEALLDRAGMTNGKTVLIHAGAGGVGHAAIQLAKLFDNRVITTVSNDSKAEFAKSIGADKVIDYKKQDVISEVLEWTHGQGVDIAFDTVGTTVLQSCFNCVKPYGDVVTILQPTTETSWSEARKRNVRFSLELMLSPVMLDLKFAQIHQGYILQQCATLFDQQKLLVSIAQSFKLNKAAAAQDYLETRRPIGKVMLTVP